MQDDQSLSSQRVRNKVYFRVRHYGYYDQRLSASCFILLSDVQRYPVVFISFHDSYRMEALSCSNSLVPRPDPRPCTRSSNYADQQQLTHVCIPLLRSRSSRCLFSRSRQPLFQPRCGNSALTSPTACVDGAQASRPFEHSWFRLRL